MVADVLLAVVRESRAHQCQQGAKRTLIGVVDFFRDVGYGSTRGGEGHERVDPHTREDHTQKPETLTN